MLDDVMGIPHCIHMATTTVRARAPRCLVAWERAIDIPEWLGGGNGGRNGLALRPLVMFLGS